jgi:hypothetical protein
MGLADAKIVENTIFVSSAAVPETKDFRFAGQSNPP